MGEEAKQEEAKAAEAPPKQEEKPSGQQKDEKQGEEKEDDGKPSPPPPTVLFVDLHCVGCVKKIERFILKCRGVQEVQTNMEKNEVTVRGAVDPQTLCSLIQKKTCKRVKLISPLDTTASNKPESKPPPQNQPSLSGPSVPTTTCLLEAVSEITTVELQVNMHCEACAQQLKRRILKMRGVQAADTDLNGKKVTVTGTMNGDKLVEYIHRRTGKIARIIPPPPPPPPPPEEKKPAAVEEKKEENDKKPQEEKKDDVKGEEEKKEEADLKLADGNKEEKAVAEGGNEKPGKEGAAAELAIVSVDEMAKRMMYWNGAGGSLMNHEDDMARRMMMMHHWMPMPMLIPTPAMYVFGHPQLPPPPPPQMFSDENPNACCIS